MKQNTVNFKQQGFLAKGSIYLKKTKLKPKLQKDLLRLQIITDVDLYMMYYNSLQKE